MGGIHYLTANSAALAYKHETTRLHIPEHGIIHHTTPTFSSYPTVHSRGRKYRRCHCSICIAERYLLVRRPPLYVVCWTLYSWLKNACCHSLTLRQLQGYLICCAKLLFGWSDIFWTESSRSVLILYTHFIMHIFQSTQLYNKSMGFLFVRYIVSRKNPQIRFSCLSDY